jgi:hypothetical protein
MEQTLVHIATDFAWVFLIVFVLAIVGVIAIVKWIIDLVTGAERAVVNEAESIGNKLHRG